MLNELTADKQSIFARFSSHHAPVPLYLVTGFLEAGKTTFISHAIERYAVQNKGDVKHVLYVANESGHHCLFAGEKPLEQFSLPVAEQLVEVAVFRRFDCFVYVCVLRPVGGSEWQSAVWEKLLQLPMQMIALASAEKKLPTASDTSQGRSLLSAREKKAHIYATCFVEANGSFSLDAFCSSLPRRKFRVVEIFHLQNLEQFQWQFQALGDLVRGNLVQSQTIVLTSRQAFLPERTEPVLRQLKSLNPRARRLLWRREEGLPSPLSFDPKEVPGTAFKLIATGLGAWSFFILWQFLRLPSMAVWNEGFQRVGQFFLSLLFQIVPFLLISAFVSSVLQLLVKENAIYRLFARRSWLALPLALGAGFVLPICDCGLIPIVTRLRQKGLPLPYAVLFFISATVTNPLVLASTLLAFPGQKEVYVFRLGLTWLVGLAMVLLLYFIERGRGKRDELGQVAILNCASGYLGRFDGGLLWKRFAAVMRHTAQEFMTLLTYIIPGILVSSLIHQFVQLKLDFVLRDSLLWQWVGLLLAVFFMSVCANSNAFIAKSFTGVFPFPILLIYMVFSPLLDFKNLLLFSNGFGKKRLWQYIVLLLLLLHLAFLAAQVLPAGFFPRFGLGVLS